jgi:glycerol-3-phosphate acyltransferase PlsY
MAIYIIIVVLAYLLGSIPFGLILARVFLDTDVRQIGSGNIGATNVLRTGSKKLGIATLLLDAGKGFAAVSLAHVLAGSEPHAAALLPALAAVSAMLGHIFPVWLKFKGGKGVATGVGVFLALVPKAVLIVLGVFLLIFGASRYVSLASIIATAAFPAVSYLYIRETRNVVLMPFIVAASLLIIVKHHQNIRRLLSGTEHRLEFTKR